MIRVRADQKRSRGSSSIQALKSATWPPCTSTTRSRSPRRTTHAAPWPPGTSTLRATLSSIAGSLHRGAPARSRRPPGARPLRRGHRARAATGLGERLGVVVLVVPAGDLLGRRGPDALVAENVLQALGDPLGAKRLAGDERVEAQAEDAARARALLV